MADVLLYILHQGDLGCAQQHNEAEQLPHLDFEAAPVAAIACMQLICSVPQQRNTRRRGHRVP